MRFGCAAIGLLLLADFASATPGPGSLLVVCTENGDNTCHGTVASMLATGAFTSVDGLDVTASTPALSALSGYGNVLAYTDFAPTDPTGLGNLLASYYALGGKRLTVATGAFSVGFAISGAVMTGSNAGLVNLGTNGDLSGSLTAVVPSDVIFTGINLASVTYFHNSNFAHAGLGSGATLLANDGAGVNVIARSANGIVDINLFPGPQYGSNNTAFYSLVAATFRAPASTVPAVSPLMGLLLAIGMALLAWRRLSRQTA